MPATASSQVVKAIKKVLPSVVSIVMTKNLDFSKIRVDALSAKTAVKKRKIRVGGGSGFIAHESGIILTNRHVLEDATADFLVVLQTGQKIKPEILACDPINDVAILKIERPKEIKELPAALLGDSDKIELGQTVIAIGNALGMFKNTVSCGVVSGLSREIQAENELSRKKTKLRGLIQTDAAINPGNSGGPLVDLRGYAVGINAAMVSGAQSIGFALPVNNAKEDLFELEKYGRLIEPYLGVRYLTINEQARQDFNLPVNQGALIIAEHDFSTGKQQAIVPASPAHKAGLAETDIILTINSQPVSWEKTINDILQECPINEKIPFKILRKNKEKIIWVVLEEKTKPKNL
ncbi:MAG: trypsin-like peptidase domain-containing protein [Patescibacteria group bacterium]|nr:trypsin-like peptidase domain-containing protein [Patescibacteria group bacterium]